ncbi:hypothetical protein [Nonomuraea basaltis]|uniref:hypothetical protein n=1 Tax=Nonomuraea basaltis TaxID=2495887 RepID=UPI00110C4365|nr:hypothetical protein [Nonomuraea basaltis]TMR89057.1 hypothetical protein EJK15_62825 [Nonomuraea basaltis]
MRLRGFAALAACLAGCLAACSTVSGAGAGQATGERAPRILRADGDGAVVFDPGQATISGFVRTGARVWRNAAIAETATDIVCLARCPATTWSTGSAKNGTGSHDPSQTVQVSGSWNTYGRFHFIFDINNATDPDCHATTSRF